MTFTTPFTAVTGAVITASGWNASARDNLLHLRALLPDASGAGLPLISAGPTSAAFGQLTSTGIAAGAVVDHLGYTPVNKAGDTLSGKLTFSDNNEGIVLSGGSEVRDSSAFPGLVVTAYQDAFYLYDAAQSTQIFRAVASQSEPYFKGNKIWHAANDGAGSGLDADTIDGINPTATPSSGVIPISNSSGSLDAWVTAATSVPSGLVAMFRTNAAIASGWTRETNLDGRIPVGAGTTFGVTFTEATNYGSSWDHVHTITGSISVTGPSDFNGLGNNGGAATPSTSHGHGLSGGYGVSTASWVIPSRAYVFAIKS